MEGPEIKAVEAVIDNGSFGKRTLRFETGRLAQQADGAVAAYLDDDSMILSTTTAGSSPKENYDFFPLTVDVEEKMYAAGKIPGSFFRREGRPSSEAILACRIIDRPLRPLFPHTLRNEVQVVETVLAVNPDDAYDVVALNAASASTMISGLPFEGPVSGVRLALIDGQWVAFPRWSERERAVFEIVVAGRVVENGDVAIAMIEAGAGKNAWHLIYDEGQTKPDEEVVAGGLEAAKPFIKVICEAQAELKKIAAKETKEFQLFPEYTEDLYNRIDEIAHADLDEALSIAEKLPRQDRIHEIKEGVKATLAGEFTDMEDAEKDKEIGNAFKELQRQIVRRRILTQDYRIDGRGLRDIRTLSAEVDIVPRVHGSALFQRGETQILGVTTLNMLKMEQQIDALSGRTIVVGGGNVAIDVARNACRLGSEHVEMFCLESEAQMPASEEERHEAVEDGTHISCGWGPKEVHLDEAGRVCGITFKRCTRVFDDEGRFAPEYDENDLRRVDADRVVMSIGQSIVWGDLLAGSKVELGRGQGALADPQTYQTAEPDIFVGGDVYTGPSFAIDAIAAGHEAAVSIHRFVQPGSTLTIGRNQRRYTALDRDDVVLESYDNASREVAHVDREREKAAPFSEYVETFTEEQVRAETARCLGCGASIVDPNKCIGCGLCTTKCAFDAIHLDRDRPECSTMVKYEQKLPSLGKYALKRAIKIKFGRK